MHGGHEARDNLNREINPIACWLSKEAWLFAYLLHRGSLLVASDRSHSSISQAVMAGEKRKAIPTETRNALSQQQFSKFIKHRR